MSRSIALVTLVVCDYDEAIAFFTEALRFTVSEDTPLGDGKRWVVIAPPEGRGAALLLARAAIPEQTAHIGSQTGGRVAMFLHTDDFWDDYRHMQAHGVRFAETPREEPYGRVVVFYDRHACRLYGTSGTWCSPRNRGAPLCTWRRRGRHPHRTTERRQLDRNRCDNSFTCRGVMPGTREIALFWHLLFRG